MVAGMANASGTEAVSIDRIDRSVRIDAGYMSRSDAHNNASTEEWLGHVEVSLPRGGAAHASQFFMVNSEQIEGEMRVMSNMSRRLNAASSSLEVAFTVSRSDYSKPDENWGWSGDGAMEALYGGAEAFAELPACRMNLRGLLAYAELASTTSFPLKAKGIPTFGSSFGRNRGSMGITLTRDGRRFEQELLAPSRRHGTQEFDHVLELPPGEYVLQVECGLQESSFRPGGPVLGEVVVELGIAFESMQPGSAEPRNLNASGYWLQTAGTFHDWWHHVRNTDTDTNPEQQAFYEEQWYRHAMDLGRQYVDGGTVYAIDPTYWHGFIFTRVEKEDASTDTFDSYSDLSVSLRMSLDEITDVGIATLCAFKNETDTDGANEGECSVRIYSHNESENVWTQTWQSDPNKAASSRQFVESQNWITLEPGIYRISFHSKSDASDVRGEDTGNENGFWYALAFETP